MTRAENKKYRRHDPADDKKPLYYPVHFVRKVPVGPPNGCQLHWTVLETRRNGEEWFEKLIVSIGTQGLMNPLIVHNGIDKLLADSPMMVVHGGNRYRALRRLGWKHAPCLIAGPLPPQFKDQAIECATLADIQKYVMDGRVVNHPGGIRVFDAAIAQTGIVTQNPEPYFDVD